MKRLHAHIAVEDLPRSAKFYSTLFATSPIVLMDDYATWMLDDPRVNLAASAGGAAPGAEHRGIRAETGEELDAVYKRLKQADAPVLGEGASVCCDAQSEKSWVNDPAGVPWEVFHAVGDSAVYGGGPALEGARLCAKPTVMAVQVAACWPAPKAGTTTPGCCV
jgi:hypothetical protein